MNDIDEQIQIVNWFAEQMVDKLKANVHKGGWDKSNPWWLLRRLKEEVAELIDAMERAYDGRISSEEVIKEAADVANFAMMIADKMKTF